MDRTVVDIYLDSPARALERAGLAARIRSELGRHRLTVKSRAVPLDGLRHERLEVEGPALPTLRPATWPRSAARGLVETVLGGQELEVIARLRQHRRTLPIRHGTTVVELSLDDLEALDLGQPELVVARTTELEAEVLAGDDAPVEALAAALLRLDGLRPASGSKLDWARAAVQPADR